MCPPASTRQVGSRQIALAGIEVVGAVRGRGVDRAGARVGGDVGAQYAEDRAFQERMLEGYAFEQGALEAGKLFRVAKPAGRGHLFSQRGGDKIGLAGPGLQRHIVEVGMKGHGQRCGQRPRGGGPDDR